MIKKFDRTIAQKLRTEIDEALKPLNAKYGIEIYTGSCTYGDTEMHYKLQVKVTDKEAIQAKKTDEWNKYCELYGFRKEDLGKIFKVRFEDYKIVGIEPKRAKYDLRAERVSDGKVVLFVSRDISKKLHPEQALTQGVQE